MLCLPKINFLSRSAQKNVLPFILFIITIAIAGCSVAPYRVNPITRDCQENAFIPGIPGARYWGDQPPQGVERWFESSVAEIKRDYPAIFGTPHNYLALSGGGANGAYGAGLLVGWSKRGDRPEFTMVTGISTGALIAPFVFLGPKYDPVLEHVYTGLSTDDLIERRGLFEIIRNDSLMSTRPLRQLIAHYINDHLIEELSNEQRRGRSLLISTTNIDAARPVTWDITRIAASGAPQALDLIRDIILASASIPGLFPPVSINVESCNRKFQEIHVDGGVTSQVFLYPAGLNWKRVTDKLKVPGKARLYLIRNSHTAPGFKSIDRRIIPIMARSLSSLIRTQGIGDIARIYFLTQRDGVEFNLAFIPETFTAQPKESFDKDYMKQLFKLGYNESISGYQWITRSQPVD
ncbi:MAG: patatin-like phospholipase family protein [Desulfotignum sp.]|nr:patatin-like phospholipase family protein [Desulfotignum sp.]